MPIIRMFELYDENDELLDRWFGGGTDLTPYFLVEEDGRHFHQTYKKVCMISLMKFIISVSSKRTATSIFVNKHRNNEAQGDRWNILRQKKTG